MRRILFIVAMALISISVQAQQRVKGVVTDQAGKPMIGVVVKIAEPQNSKIGVVTGIDGAYEIPADKGTTLEFSYIDYETQQVKVDGRNQIDVKMERSASAVESKMLYIVDGVIASSEAVNALSPDKIKNMNIMKGIESVAIINTKEGAGAIKIVGADGDNTTQMYYVDDAGNKSNVQTITVKRDGSVSSSSSNSGDFTSTTTTTTNGKSETVEIRGTVGKPMSIRTVGSSGEPLVIVRIHSGEIAKGDIDNIKSNMIKAVSVIKNQNAVTEFEQYGDVSNGVVFIDLKDGYTFDDIKHPVDKSDEKEVKVVKVEARPRDPNAPAIPKRK